MHKQMIPNNPWVAPIAPLDSAVGRLVGEVVGVVVGEVFVDVGEIVVGALVGDMVGTTVLKDTTEFPPTPIVATSAGEKE
jgi:hypothetical protein